MKPVRNQAARVLVLLLLGAPGAARGQEAAASPGAAGQAAEARDPDDPAPSIDTESGRRGDQTAKAPASPASDDRPWAEGVPYEAQVQARDLFMKGNVLLRDTLFARAAAKYEEAIALWAHPAFLYNLALARIHLDQPIAAYESMRAALRHGPRPIGEDRYEHAQSYLELLRSQLAEIEVECDQPGAQVSLDGEPLFEAPGHHRRLVRPGGHQVVASGAGRIPATRELVLAPGEHTRVDIAPLYLQVRETRRWPAWKPWAVVGAGAAVALAGGALQWSAERELQAFDKGVQGLSCGDEDLVDGGTASDGCTGDEVPPEVAVHQRRATWQRRAAVAAYAAGGAALVTGAVLLVLNRAQPVRQYTEQPHAWLRVAPDRFGVAARISF